MVVRSVCFSRKLVLKNLFVATVSQLVLKRGECMGDNKKKLGESDLRQASVGFTRLAFLLFPTRCWHVGKKVVAWDPEEKRAFNLGTALAPDLFRYGVLSLMGPTHVPYICILRKIFDNFEASNHKSYFFIKNLFNKFNKLSYYAT